MDYRAVHAINFIVFGHNSTTRGTIDVLDTFHSIIWLEKCPMIAGALEMLYWKSCSLTPLYQASAHCAVIHVANRTTLLNSPWSICPSLTRFLKARLINVVKFCSQQTPSNFFWGFCHCAGMYSDFVRIPSSASLYVFRYWPKMAKMHILRNLFWHT